MKDEDFLADVRNALKEGCARDPIRLHVWWLGQSGFLVHHGGRFLLLDPYLSDSLTKKYAGTDKPHVRVWPRVVAPERLDFVDVVSSSHSHTDHLDPETLRPLFAANPNLTLVAPESARIEAAARAGIDPREIVGVDKGASVEIKGFRFTGIAAAHNSIEYDSNGRCKFLGYVIEFGNWRIYHSGDTLLYAGLAECLRDFGPIDLMMLPINGNIPERRVAGNMDGPEAARLAREVNAKMV